ncbi:MAG: hypothetical protein IPP79_20125 [Chitinophagaceae bacterium]|nr:hypothetical protein [Chitinophagaceae bacterium]
MNVGDIFLHQTKIIEIELAETLVTYTKTVDFLECITDNYSQITKSITPLIEDEFRNWQEEFKIIDFRKEFEPVYLRIPRCETKPIVWEIAFESDHDRNHVFH